MTKTDLAQSNETLLETLSQLILLISQLPTKRLNKVEISTDSLLTNFKSLQEYYRNTLETGYIRGTRADEILFRIIKSL